MFYTDITSGSVVRFQLSSVVCPDREQILKKITNRLNLTGKVVQFSDAGDKHDYYAIVQVGGILNPLIVPVNQIELCQVPLDKEALTIEREK